MKYNVSKDGGFHTLGIYMLGKLKYQKNRFLEEFSEDDMFDFDDVYQNYVYHIDFEKSVMNVFEIKNGNLIDINKEAIEILENERRDLVELIDYKLNIEDKFNKIQKIIETLEDNEFMDVGTSELSPTKASIKRVEEAINIKLPKSYLWFLENYGYINIFDMEVYSIYDDFDSKIPSSDLEYNYGLDKKFIESYEIPIFNDEFGQLFVMDSSKEDDEGEYPIYRKFSESGEAHVYYSKNFLEFLEKQLKDIKS